MADLFATPVYEDDDITAVTNDDRADPSLAGLTDEEIRSAKTPVGGLFDTPVYEDEAPTATAAPAEQPGYTLGNQLRKVGDRAGRVLSQMTIGLADTIGDLAPDWMNAGIVWDENGVRLAYGKEYEEKSLVANVADVLRDPERPIIEHRDTVTFDQVKQAFNSGDNAAAAKAAGVFALENGITSLPDMIAMLAAGPSYFSGLASDFTQQRAANNAHEKPTLEDVAIGTATAAVSAALEKFGAERVLGTLASGGKAGLRRFLEGVVAETATEAVQSPIEAAGTALGTPKSPTMSALGDETMAGALGGLGGGVALGGPVHGAQAVFGQPGEDAPSPLKAIDNAPPEVSAVQEAQQRARADVAARGGDKLDQEVAAALAAAEVSSHRRGAHDITAPKVREAARQLKVEQEYAEGTAQSEEDNARAQIQAEAAARYEQGLPAPAAAPLVPTKVSKMVSPDSAVLKPPQAPVFDVAAREADAAKDADFTKAKAQRDREVATQQAFEGEPVRATIGELAAPKTLAERRARKPIAPVSTEKTSTSPEVFAIRESRTPGENLASSEQVAPKLPALPAPKTARVEVDSAGTARNVSEAELEQRQTEAKGPPMREGLSTVTKEIPAAPAREVAPRTLAERRAEIAAQRQQIETAAAEAASSPKNDLAEPTKAQREAGNYKKGHVKLHGMDISIETPRGGLRTFKGGSGSRRMRDHYGYVRRTEGADGDQVDVFVGDQPDSPKVFVIDQVKQEDGSFDEHKAMVGYPDRESAVAAYKRNYQDGWKVGPVTEMAVGEFRKWSQEGNTKAPLNADALRLGRTLAQRRARRGDDGRLADDGSVRHIANEGDKTHVVRSANGFTKATEQGEFLRITDTKTERIARGKGEGAERMTKLAAVAAKKGLTLSSDNRVSEPAQRVYEALKAAGWTVKRNPAERDPGTGELISRSELKPVYEVAPPKTLADRRQATTPQETSNSLKDPVRASMPRDAISEEEQAAPKITHEEALAAVKPLFDEIGRETNFVHARPQDMPRNIYESALARFGERRVNNARGYYHPLTDTTHIFAGNHVSTDRVIQTALHEIVAHKGVRQLLGKQYGNTMLDVFKGAKERAWINDYAEQHGLDTKDQGHQVILADEYIASIAERNTDQGAFEKLLAAVRAVLRKLGVVDKWTEADIRRLLAKSRSGLREASKHGRDAGPYGERLADGDVRPPRTPANHPNSRLFKMNVTVEDQANHNPGFVRSRLDAVRDFGVNAIPAALATIPRRNLPDFMAPDKMPSMKAYIRAAQRLDGRRSELLQIADDTAKRWLTFTSKNKEQGRILGELMHAATLATVDPANDYRSLYSGMRRGKPIALTPEQQAIEAQRRGQHRALKAFWNKLDGEAKAIYIEVRDSYARQRDLTQEGLEARINAAEADGKTKAALIDSLRTRFEAGRVAGPYFPLARFGKHWASAKDKNGNTIAFSRFEKPSEQRAWQNEMRRAGYTVDGGVKADDASIVKRVDPGFVAKIAGMLDQIDPELADDVWQQYLRALPEMSMRKHFIHRKGRLGFTADALRAFAFQQFHGAHQIAKLEHMAVMDSLVEQIAVEAAKLQNTTEEKWSAGLRDEFAKRHAWAKAPQSALWATKLTGLGFAFYLGLTPAAALVNLTQTAIVAMPTLAARFNWLGAGTELTKAAALYAGSRGPMANRLRGDEQKAFEEAQRVGLFDKTQAHDLAGLGEEGSVDYGSTRQKVSAVISWAFHKTEEANRQVTFLAAYRLSRKKGRGHEDAILEAEDLTWDSHFDYANTNRPRIIQNDAAKVMFLFRQYSLNMTYRLARDFNDSLRGATPKAKKEARTRFAGIMGQTMLFAGASGLPMFWLVKFICNNLFGDDDEPFDTEAAMRATLFEMGGEKFSQAIVDGPVSALSGADVSSRVGLNNLWLREPPEGVEGKDLGLYYLKEAAGPMADMFVRGFDAFQRNEDGLGDRAAEMVTPKAVADALKMIRYAREGVTSQRGDEILPATEISTYELFLQGMGFVPSDVALQFDQNRIVKAAEQRIEDRRARLMNQFALAAQNDDPQARTDTLAEIQAFGKKHPSRTIDFDALWASAKARGRYSIEAVNGVRVEPGLRYLHQKLKFTEDTNVQPAP